MRLVDAWRQLAGRPSHHRMGRRVVSTALLGPEAAGRLAGSHGDGITRAGRDGAQRRNCLSSLRLRDGHGHVRTCFHSQGFATRRQPTAAAGSARLQGPAAAGHKYI